MLLNTINPSLLQLDLPELQKLVISTSTSGGGLGDLLEGVWDFLLNIFIFLVLVAKKILVVKEIVVAMKNLKALLNLSNNARL